MPAAGASVSNLEATTNGAPTGTQSYTVDVLDNTAGTVALSCSVTSSSAFCTNTGSATVTAGHYLEVRITHVNGAAGKPWRVSFRY
jgi:hypothetical protein